MKKLFFAILACMVFAGCTQVETGEVGLRRHYNGVIDMTTLEPDMYSTVSSTIIILSNKEILISEDDVRPQTKDKSTLSKFSFNFTYRVQTPSIPELYTKYAATSHLENPQNHHEIFPMGNFVNGLMRSAANEAVSEYNALDANTNRDKIAERMVQVANQKMKREGLEGKVSIVQVNLKDVVPEKSIIDSANMVINNTNLLASKQKEVEISKQEALKMQIAATQTDDKYLRLLYAQGFKAAAENGNLIIVPGNFTSLGQLAPETKK